MNRTFIACVIAVSITDSAMAINPASEAWKKKIQNQITIGNLMDDEVYAAQAELDDAKSGQAETANIPQLELRLQRIKDKQLAAYTKAIHQTIEAYGLEPRSRRGTSVISRTAGREIHWIPVAGDQPTRFIQGADGEFGETVRTPISWGGRTFIDGVSYINPETIKMGPEFIASTVLHERIHFEQITTRGRGDKMSSAEREMEAYKAEKANIDSFFDASSPYRQYAETHVDDLIAIHQRRADEARAAKRGLTGVLNRYFPPKPNPDFDDATPHAPAKLAALRRQSDDFEAEIREESRRVIARARTAAMMALLEKEKQERLERDKERERLERERLKREDEARQAEAGRRAQAALQDQERAERERAHKEQAHWDEVARLKKERIDANFSRLAARCGYELEYASKQDRTIIGFRDPWGTGSPHSFKDRVPPETLDDFELMLAVSRACDDAEHDNTRKGIKACNNAPAMLPTRFNFGAFPGIMAANDIHFKCAEHMRDEMMNFKNRKSFEQAIAGYQKTLRRNKELEDNLREYQERVKRGEGRPPRDDDRTTSPDEGKEGCRWDGNIGGRVCPY